MSSSGLLLIDKPAGKTSFRVIADIRKRLGIGKIGHAGTLDLFATGLLLVATESATKALSHLILARKAYYAEITFGVDSPTLDPMGELAVDDTAFSLPQVRLQQALNRFRGDIMQKPPDFSALKLRGKRASDRVMAGEQVDLPSRPVAVYKLDLVDTGIHQQGVLQGQPYASLRLEVGSGFYVRSLARDLGVALGTRAVCSALRREAVGRFTVNDALTPDSVTPEAIRPLRPDDFSLETCRLTDRQAADFFQGRSIVLPQAQSREVAVFLAEEWVGFAKVENGVLRPERVVRPAGS